MECERETVAVIKSNMRPEHFDKQNVPSDWGNVPSETQSLAPVSSKPWRECRVRGPSQFNRS